MAGASAVLPVCTDPPVIDEIIYFDKVKFNKMNLLAKLAYFQEMRRLLHSKKFDLVIDMQGLFKKCGACSYQRLF